MASVYWELQGVLFIDILYNNELSKQLTTQIIIRSFLKTE
jgi:hypothetical protein